MADLGPHGVADQQNDYALGAAANAAAGGGDDANEAGDNGKKRKFQNSNAGGGAGAGDEDDEDDEKGGKERRKIDIKFIQDKSRRHITFSKRKAGIMKKVSSDVMDDAARDARAMDGWLTFCN